MIIPPDTYHDCVMLLPHNSGGYGSTGYADGTIIQCPADGSWWFSAPCYQSFGPTSTWRKVRPWHFGLWKRINREILSSM